MDVYAQPAQIVKYEALRKNCLPTMTLFLYIHLNTTPPLNQFETTAM